MFQLTPPREPVWFEPAEGIRFRLRFGPTEALNAARRGARLSGLDPNQVDPEFAFVVGAAIYGVTEWEGVGDANGQPAEPTAENIARLLSQRPDVYDAFAAEYVDPLMVLLSEKKGSGRSPNGTSGTADPASATPALPTAESAPTS